MKIRSYEFEFQHQTPGSPMQKILITIGVIVIIIGLLWPWLVKLPLGRLPGDIIINKPHLKIIIPITTMIIVSIIISVILWILRK